MRPQPKPEKDDYSGSNNLRGRAALITGGDSSIVRAVAFAFAREGANVALVYLNEDADVRKTQALVERQGARCLLLRGDIGQPAFCEQAVYETVRELGRLDILVNNAGEQHPQDSIGPERVDTFRTHILSMFYVTSAALPHLERGSTIINTSSATACRGRPTLVDHATIKDAIVAFTRSLAGNLDERGVKVHAIAEERASDVRLQDTGDAEEIASRYVLLASEEARTRSISW